jgi:hypothetical protein
MFNDKKDKLIAVLFVLLGFLLYSLIIKNKDEGPDNKKIYQNTIDSLHRSIDSLNVRIKKEDTIISYWRSIDKELNQQVIDLKDRLKKAKGSRDTSIRKIDTLPSSELVNMLNQRYPKDTVTDKHPVAKPVLVSINEDLVKLDYSNEIIKIQDSIITTDSVRLAGKDSTITSFERKENFYKDQTSKFLGIEDNYKKIVDEYKIGEKKSKKKLVASKLKTWTAIGLFVSYIIIRN